MPDFDRIKNQFLQESAEDFVGLWELVRIVRRECESEDPDVVRALTMEVLGRELIFGSIRAGFPDKSGQGFCPWQVDNSEALDRIEAEWRALGRDPDIGEIVWFTAGD